MNNVSTLESFTESLPESLDFYELGRVLVDSGSAENTTLPDLLPELALLNARAFRLFAMDDSEQDEFIGLLFFPSIEDESTYEEFGNVVFSQCLNSQPGLWISPPVEMDSQDAIRMAQGLRDLFVRKYLHIHEGRARPLWVLMGLKPGAKVAHA